MRIGPAAAALAAVLAASTPRSAGAMQWARVQMVEDISVSDLSGSRAVFSDFATILTYELALDTWVSASSTTTPNIVGLELFGDLAFALKPSGEVLPLRYEANGWLAEPVITGGCLGCTLTVDSTGVVTALGRAHLGEILMLDRVGNTWVPSQTLADVPSYRLGQAVSLEGDTLATCAPEEPNSLGANTRGVVHVFERSAGVWGETSAIPVAITCGSVCTHVFLRDDRITVLGGCEIQSFERSGAEWLEIGPPASFYGTAADTTLAGNALVLGEAGAEYNGLLGAGRVEIFRPVPTGWELEATLLPQETETGLGIHVGGTDGWLLVDNGAGQAQFFARVGTTCTTGDECPTGHCVDGFCCDSSCDGSCVACDLPGDEGVCSLVTGAPRNDHTACEAPSCSGGTLDQGASCNGLVPECTPLPTVSCAPFVCSEGACRSPCTTKDDCVVQHVCANGACIPDSTSCATETILVHADGSTDDCAPYRCGSTGACVTHCASTEECAPGTVCTAEGSCLPTDTIEGRGSSCAAERRAPRSTDGMFWLGALASLTALRRLSARCLRAPGSRRPAPRCRSASLPSSSADQ